MNKRLPVRPLINQNFIRPGLVVGGSLAKLGEPTTPYADETLAILQPVF
jgi:hypothetical protein